MNSANATDVKVNAPVTDAFSEILTPEALQFVALLAERFEARRQELLDRRRTVQANIDRGNLPDFLPDYTGGLP